MKKTLAAVSVAVLALAVGIEAGAGSTHALGFTEDPPGIAIPVLAAIDVALLLRFGLTAFGTLISGAIQSKIDGLATLFVGIGLVLLGLASALAAFGLLLTMVGLVLAVPFGTLIYLALFGAFAKGTASALLSLAMSLKLGAMVAFVLWNLHVLRSKSTVLLALTSLLLTALISLLHGLVPGFLTSITDAIAAIIVGIVSIVWGIALACFGVPAVFRAVRAAVPV